MALKAKPLRVQHAYEQVSQEIETQILSGALKPGDPLPGEVEMATMFAVNRSTVREGIRRLECEGFVRRTSPRKMVVSIPRMAELSSRQTRALGMLEVSFIELWNVALATEPLAAELAAMHAGPDDLAALDAIHAALIAAEDEGKTSAELDTAFHSRIAAASKNRVLQLAREPIGFLLYSGIDALIPNLPQALSRQVVAHGHVIEAVRAGDPPSARNWMRRHIDDFKRGYELAGLPLDAPLAGVTSKLADMGQTP
ncbi:putative transcriptional regulator protein, GntR family [Sulfitobacter noctilucae]|uniref:FadR/GntR family transcriptional regulator n=1 Tax=Sulfitobacter noctilucae TaxID=1342302 RepID=UPI0004692467|nr:FCD domain-containing protein [Sulfitobacter noctilucae]KIN65562.1 putative transcriptional regulator protein, GntR family [Sulfitobacter noctilucae]